MSPVRQRIVTIVLGAVLIFGLGYFFGQQNYQVRLSGAKITFTHQAPPAGEKIDFQLFWDVYGALQKDYYDQSKLDGTKILYGAIQGMVASLGDPFTSFLTPEQNQAFQGDLAGTYEGVGIELGFKDGRMVVIAPLSSSPAQSSGVKAGDFIVKIGDKSTESMTLPEAVVLIRGSAGTKVTITFQRGGGEPFELTLTRAKIQVKSVNFTDKGGGVGYLKLSRFGDSTNSEWAAAVAAAVTAKSKVIVLDLRDNPGGLLDSAVYVASEFLARGSVVVRQESVATSRDYKVERAGKLVSVPVVVILNGGSASASEILAGALQDLGRAELVGEQSFGKGTVQVPLDVDCQAKSETPCPSLHVTISKWLTPNGRWIHGTGLTPDTKVALTAEDFKAGRDPQLIRALEVARGEIR